MKKTLFALLGFILAPAAAMADDDAPFGIEQDLPLNRVVWLTTHNSFNTGLLAPNQSHSIQQQLEAGVRGLMLDVYDSGGKLYLCHGTCVGARLTLASVLRDTILPFMRKRPDAVIAIHLEDHVNRAQLVRELSTVEGVSRLSFDPDAWTTPEWPTYRQLVESGQRLLIFAQQAGNSGTLPTPGGPVHVMYDQDYTVENYWSLGKFTFTHDNRCYSRWDGVPLDSPAIASGQGWPRLFVMNQFHGVPLSGHSATDNAYGALRDRIDTWCAPTAKRRPNTIAVDHYHEGQAGKVVAALNARAI